LRIRAVRAVPAIEWRWGIGELGDFDAMRYLGTTVYLCAIVNVGIASLFFFPLLLLLIPLAIAAVHSFVRDFRDM
jgi:hypothetical protein